MTAPTQPPAPQPAPQPEAGARIDLWLWRARFFKKRSEASAFVAKKGVRVERAGAMVRVAKAGWRVRPGDVVTFARGGHVSCVRVVALGVRRGPASEARLLYGVVDAAPDPAGAKEAGSDA